MLIPSSKWEVRQKKQFQDKHDPFQEAIDGGVRKGYAFNDFSQDLYSSLYQIEPEFPEKATPGAAWAKKALDELKSLPEFKQIRESGTKCDSFQSGLGATVLTKHFAESLPQAPEKENPDDIQNQIDNLNSFLEDFSEDELNNSPKLQKMQDNLEWLNDEHMMSADMWEKAADEIDSGKLRQVMRRALTEAQEAIDEAEETANAFGYGTEPGTDGYTDPQRKLAIAQKIKNNPKLKEIAELAGRFRREARKEQSNKKLPGPDELADVEMGDDLGRLIPSELMKLNDPVMEPMFYKGFLEKALIQYKLVEAIKESKGDIIMCIDNSGSMTMRYGPFTGEVWSKAVALAMCQIAVDQRRRFVIIHFDSSVKKVYQFDPEKVIPEDLLDACSYFSGGGTDFEPPFKKAFEIISDSPKFKKADVVFVTDGNAPLNNASDVIELKKLTEARIFSIIIGFAAANLEPVSDEMTPVLRDLAGDDAEEIKKIIFSV
jgi:uncharacterized protein with von Willebrand factor type A (vWA) domain